MCALRDFWPSGHMLLRLLPGYFACLFVCLCRVWVDISCDFGLTVGVFIAAVAGFSFFFLIRFMCASGYRTLCSTTCLSIYILVCANV